jgi:hypothetical protein
MTPCINLYNNLVPRMNWDDFENFPQMKLLTADLTHYQKLTNWLIKIIQKIDKENIYIIEDHGQILKYLPSNEKLNIYNIDHHHDCGYEMDENKIINNELKLHCGNWGLMIKQEDMLNNFYWINNRNSIYPPEEKRLVNFNSYDLINFNLDNLPVPDKLILCLSEPWVPPMFRPLFFTWLDILNEHYHTRFEIDFERCQ